MLEVSERFKERSFENLKTDLIAKVSIVGGDEITHENGFLSFKILEEAGIASTSMAVATLTLKGFVELIDKSFYLSYGYKFDGEEDYLTFGPFKVVEQSYDEKTKKSTFIAYDLMYEFCKEYKMDFKEFPMKADKYLEEISHVIGVENEITTIPYVIKQDYFNGTGYEVRRVIENVVELSNQIAFFRYGKLTNKSFEEVDVTLTKSNLTGFTILPQFGPVDSLVLSRTPQEDNVYPAGVNPETVKHEVKISNNLIVDLERENVIDTLFPRYEDLTLQPFSLSTIGLGFLELGDIVKTSIDDKIYDLTILGKELVIANGIKETLFCEEVSKSSTKYQYASDSRRNQITTELLVDKQKGEIKSLIKEVGDRTDKDTSITQDVDSINAKVQSISVGTNLILNLNAMLDMVNNTYPYYIFNQNGLQTVFQTIQQTRHMGSPIFRVVQDRNSVSGYSKHYEFKGKALATEYAYIVPDTIYSYRCKRTKGSTPMDVYVVEYDGDKKQIKRTKFTLDGQNMIESFSFTPAQMTMWARLEFYNNIEEPFNIAEEMFVRGEPVKWSEDANEVRFYSKSLFEQLAHKIVLGVDVDGNIVQMELSSDPKEGSKVLIKADQIKLEGYTSINGGFEVLPDGRVKMVDAEVSGTIYMNRGSVGNLTLENGELTVEDSYYTKKFTQSDIGRVQSILEGTVIPSSQDFTYYDVNRDGVISIIDMVFIHRAVNGLEDNPILVKTTLNVGTSNSQIHSSIIVGDKYGKEKTSSRISSGMMKSDNGIFSKVYIENMNRDFYMLYLEEPTNGDTGYMNVRARKQGVVERA